MRGTLIAISSFSWFRIWIGLEINLLSFIPLITSSKNLFSSESSLKYFLTQALASVFFLFSILIFFLFLNFNFFFYKNIFILISLTILIKSGAAPLHFWFPRVIEGLNWQRAIILITWQKIAPLIVLSYCLNLTLLFFIIIFCVFFGRIGGLNQTSLRKLMAFSSINHLGWMLAGIIYRENMWLLYFLFYSILSLTTVLIFNNFKLFNLNQTFSFYNSTFFTKLIIFLNLLSLGGLPPFLGFFPKWLIIEIIIFINYYFILIIMLFLTLLTLYFYLRISYSVLLINYLEINWNFKFLFLKKKMKFLLFNRFISIFGLFLINFFYIIL